MTNATAWCTRHPTHHNGRLGVRSRLWLFTFGLSYSTLMKRYWLLFSQAVTVLLAAYFVVATLQPSWLRGGSTLSKAGISLLEAPSAPRTEFAPGSLAAAA